MHILVLLEEDFPELLKIIKKHFQTANIQIVNSREQLKKEIGKLKPQFIIAQLYKESDLELVEQITSVCPLIIVAKSIDQDLTVKFLHLGVVDWILLQDLDRLNVRLRLLSTRPNILTIDADNMRLFLNVIENLREFAIMTDLEGNILVCNKSFKQNFKSPEAIIGKNIISLILQEDRDKFKQALDNSKTNYFFEIPELNLDLDGKTFFVHVVGHSVHNESGQTENIVFLLNDITQRKQFEIQLKESEKLFRTVADTASFAIFIYQENRFVYVNPAAIEISGYSYEELMKMNFWDIIHPDYKDLVHERGIKRIQGKEVPARYEFKIIRKNNTERWIDFSGSFLEYKGKPAALGIAIDITENKIANDLLKSSQNFYMKLFNEFPALLWRTDVNGKLIYFNNTWLNFRGATLQEEINGAWQEAIHPDDANFVIKEFNSYFINKKAFEMEYRIKNKDGLYRWIFIQGCPFYDMNNQFAGYIGSGYDITEKKDYEEKINKLNEELKQKIKYLEDFKSIAIEREIKMIELKEIIQKLQSAQQ